MSAANNNTGDAQAAANAQAASSAQTAANVQAVASGQAVSSKRDASRLSWGKRIASFFGGISLAVLLLASGFLVCVQPACTNLLANSFSRVDSHTAFTHQNMVDVASATRDYAFGSHNYQALVQTIVDANVEANAKALEQDRTLTGAPKLSNIDTANLAQVQQAFSVASERFVYTDDAIAHLDDCQLVARIAYLSIGTCALCFVVSLAAMRNKRAIGLACKYAGIAVLALFAFFGAWALLNFNGMFTTFHQVFFAQGNWSFSSDSLLICALPTEFWMGMAFIWFATSAIASILSILVGKGLLGSPRNA